MKIDRKEFLNELKLREQVRKIIQIVHERNVAKEQEVLKEEKRLRKVVRQLIAEVELSDPSIGDETTAMTKLRKLIKLILSEFEEGYTSLRTSYEQRKSYRTHILNAVQDILTRGDVNYSAQDDNPADNVPTDTSADIMNEESSEEDIEEKISVDIDDESPPDRSKFLQGVRDKPVDKKEDNIDPEEEEFNKFAIPGQDKTGAVEAHESMKQTENQIAQAYARLYNAEDREIFADYLITNLQLHFDDFEEELQQVLPEPENPDYEKFKAQQPGTEPADISEPITGLMDEEEDPL
tara:strand:- start:1153 stop:2034 length:882 start_codon:yes stop_codon:yes gene_type:complete